MSKIQDAFLKIGSIDRRWIFLIIAAVVIVPLIFPVGLPIRPTDTTKNVYDSIEKLPAGSKVLLSVEYSPSTRPENHPMTISILRHLFKNNHKVFITCLWPDGQFMAQDAINQVAKQEFNKTYGVDYVFLGFRPGNEAVVKGIVSNLRKLYTVDVYQKKIDEIPLMNGINNFKDLKELDWFETVKINDELAVTLMPSQHWSKRSVLPFGPGATDKALWGSFLINYKGKKLFFSCDTGYSNIYKMMSKKFGAIDIFFINTGAYNFEIITGKRDSSIFHTNPEEALQAAKDIKAKKVIPGGLIGIGTDIVNINRLDKSLKIYGFLIYFIFSPFPE